MSYRGGRNTYYAPKGQGQGRGGRGGQGRGGGYHGRGQNRDQGYTQYTPREDQRPQTTPDVGSFPGLGGADEAFPTLGDPFPSLGSKVAQTVAAEWGQDIVKKKVEHPTPIPEPEPKKTTAKSDNTSRYQEKKLSATSNEFPQPQAFPELGAGAQESTQGSKKGYKGKNKHREEEVKEPTPQPQPQTQPQPQPQPSKGKGKPELTVFNQVLENLGASKNTRPGTFYSRREEAKVNYEIEQQPDEDDAHEEVLEHEGEAKDYYAEYEKYMREDHDKDENYDYDEGGYYEEEIGLDESEAQADNYFKQYSGDRGKGGIVLMVAEKPSIAKSITEALSGGKSKLRKGRSKFCPVHEFSGQIFGRPAYFRVTSVAGHVFTTDFPRQYQDWQKIDPLKLFDTETVKKESNPASRLIQHLQGEARNASYLVLWLDNDKEGENICFEVLDIVESYMKKENFQQVYRAKFSSIVKQDLQAAFRNIHSGPNYNESISVDARQIIDLKVGVAFSRFQTMYFTTKYPNLNTKLVSYGPCQTPTLGFCVKRDDEIKNFKPRLFYRIVPTIALPNGGTSELTWSEEKTFSQQEAHKVKSDIEKDREAIVINASSKEGVKGRPEALNTVQLLRVASAQLGIGPQQAMHIAERLYLSGYLTYPRTESTSYPGKYDFHGIVAALAKVSTFSDFASKLLQGEMRNPKGGKDVGDHPPITPTNKPGSRDSLHGDEWRIYDYVARHFLASISPDAKFIKRNVTFKTGQYEFTLSGSTSKTPGFTEIMPWVKSSDNIIPEFKVGQKCGISIIEVRTGTTSAPDHLTESELITLMEKHGIGTDASMATHINNICERNYVKVTGSNRKLVPTDLGVSLVHGYELIDADLVAPTLRANIEKSVEMIAKGKADYNAVLKEMISIFTKKFIFFKDNISKMDVIFGGSFETVEDSITHGKPYSKCGKCNRLMKYAEKFHKLHCDQCNVTLELPSGGSFKLAGDRKCPLDNFGILIYSAIGVQSARYYVCPHCYNNSPFPDISDKLTCNLCIQADCQYSVPNNEIRDCDLCKDGVLVLDQQAGTKATATCNACSAEITIAENVANVVRSAKECENCESYLFKSITLKATSAALSQMKYENVCIFCHPEFSKITQSKVLINPQGRRGGRGRGRRGGRRGRGRGRGRGRPEKDWRDI